MRIRSILRVLFLLGTFAALSRSQRKPKPTQNSRGRASDAVDEAGEGSFPASDPPGWTLGEDERA
jgi:hypothetical protein